MRTLRNTLLGGVVTLTCFAASPSFAQTASGSTYDPAYFAQYAPSTASDMIVRIPGFQLDSGDDGKRGLGQGGANVLINGARISGKTDVREQLARISASNVVKVEIVDGASLDIPGLSGQVANIITNTVGITGTWAWEGEWMKNVDPTLLSGSVNVSGETGNLSYAASLSSLARKRSRRGPETLTDISNTVFETRDRKVDVARDSLTAALDLTWTPKQDHIANLNTSYTNFNFNFRAADTRTALTDRGNNKQTEFNRAEDEWNAEIGGDYQLPVHTGKLKLIGYYRFEHSPFFSGFEEFASTGRNYGRRFINVTDEAEAIARSEYSWASSKGHDWQVAVEGAFNMLEDTSTLYNLDVDSGNFIANADLNNVMTRVEEKRAEATLTHTRSLSPKWGVQASLGAEYSVISQADNSRNFFRPKGFISTTYKHDENFTIRTKLEREVGQLNFGDFISSVSLEDEQNNTGNPDLVPAQNWNANIEFDKKFGQGNSIKAKVYGSLISDLVDRIPIGTDGDAVGNIDSAHSYGIEVNATLKGDQWGIRGAQLDLLGEITNSSVQDPLLDFTRRLSRHLKYEWRVEFRHDIPNTQWAYGGLTGFFKYSPSYRLTAITSNYRGKPYSNIYIENKDVFGFKVKASLLNLFSTSQVSQKTFYTARRDQGQIDRTEDRSEKYGLIARINISDTF